MAHAALDPVATKGQVVAGSCPTTSVYTEFALLGWAANSLARVVLYFHNTVFSLATLLPIKFPFHVFLNGITDRPSAAAESFKAIQTSASIDQVAAGVPA
jgi:hypothetical protein